MRSISNAFALSLVMVTVFALSVYSFADTTFITDVLRIGKASTSADKVIEFNIGSGASNPKLQWDVSGSKFQYANDGSTFVDIDLDSKVGGRGLSTEMISAGFSTSTDTFDENNGFASITDCGADCSDLTFSTAFASNAVCVCSGGEFAAAICITNNVSNSSVRVYSSNHSGSGVGAAQFDIICHGRR